MVLSAIQVTLRAWDTYQPISIASTLCVTYFDLKNGIMYTLAIGDTKIIVIREGKVVDESPAVLKGFNIPTVISTKNRLRTHDYVVRSAKIMKGDLCITFSDGLADNVFPDDVLHLVSNAKISHPIQFQNFVNQLAADLIRKAIHEDPSYSKEVHPFALAAAREYQFRMDQLACLEDLQDKEDTSLQLNLVTNRTIFDHRIFVDREQRYSDSQMKQLARVRGIKRDDVSTAVTYFK